MMRKQIAHALAVGAVSFVVAASAAVADDELSQRASWTTPAVADVKAQIDNWLADREIDEVTRLKVETLWPADAADADGIELLDQVAATISLVDPQTRPLVDLCRGERIAPSAPAFDFLKDDQQGEFVRHNLRLYYGRWLAQHDLFDEALEQLDGLTPANVVEPSTLLFYQSVANHQLLKKDECLTAVSTLLENENALPRRYATVAKLIEADLRPLKTDSLDEIARLMDDIERRQRLYRSGTVVRKQEDDVLAKLDKIIEELEKQQQSGGGGGSSGNNLQPSSPASDSNPLGGTGKGDVNRKKMGDGEDWGDLPPKERAAAMAELAKDLPAHYREVIEEYFRKLARDEPK